MSTTRHISLDDDHIEKMKQYIDKHNGNFGAALREMIKMAGKYSYRSNSSAIDISLLNWTLSEMDGIFIPDPCSILCIHSAEGCENIRAVDIDGSSWRDNAT